MSNLPLCSASWTQNRRSEQRVTPTASIDLHGYSQEQGIRALTNFLDQCASGTHADPRNRRGKHHARTSRVHEWVCCVTGTGAHSSTAGGPVLRTAIHKLLIKRDMEYCLARHKGSFTIRATSGHVLKQSATTQECTKIQVVQRDDNDGAFHRQSSSTALGLRRTNAHTKKRLQKACKQPQPAHLGTMDRDECPLPAEVAGDDALLQEAKGHSLNALRTRRSQNDREERQLRKVIEVSVEQEREQQQNEQEELRKVLEASVQLELDQQRREQEELDVALQLSSQQHQAAHINQEDDSDDEELERVLQLSLQQEQNLPTEDDDEILRQVLSQSNFEHQQQEHEAAESDRVLRMSMVDHEVDHTNNESIRSSAGENIALELEGVRRMPMLEKTPMVAAAFDKHGTTDEDGSDPQRLIGSHLLQQQKRSADMLSQLRDNAANSCVPPLCLPEGQSLVISQTFSGQGIQMTHAGDILGGFSGPPYPVNPSIMGTPLPTTTQPPPGIYPPLQPQMLLTPQQLTLESAAYGRMSLSPQEQPLGAKQFVTTQAILLQPQSLLTPQQLLGTDHVSS